MFTQKQLIKNFGNIINKVYEYSPDNIKEFFFQENIDIKSREQLVKNIHASLFNNHQK